MKTRAEQIEEAAKEKFSKDDCGTSFDDFMSGAEWADANPTFLNKNTAVLFEGLDQVKYSLIEETLLNRMKDLKHDHKIMREALEFYASLKNSFFINNEPLDEKATSVLAKLTIKETL